MDTKWKMKTWIQRSKTYNNSMESLSTVFKDTHPTSNTIQFHIISLLHCREQSLSHSITVIQNIKTISTATKPTIHMSAYLDTDCILVHR